MSRRDERAAGWQGADSGWLIVGSLNMRYGHGLVERYKDIADEGKSIEWSDTVGSVEKLIRRVSNE